jgi:hypothetical protein
MIRPARRRRRHEEGPAMAQVDELLVHNVFFLLEDRSPAAKNKLVEACRKYLPNHAGIVFFGCGVLAEALNREVNDRDFDVALHIVFADQKAHDLYQQTEPHHQFIAENKANWKKVRVFDSVSGQSPTP